MLRITPKAGLAIKALAEQQGAPTDGGLRIDTLATDGDTREFAVSVAAAADNFDQIITEETTGARVLVDSLTAECLEDLALDVDDTAEGIHRFQLKPDGPPH